MCFYLFGGRGQQDACGGPRTTCWSPSLLAHVGFRDWVWGAGLVAGGFPHWATLLPTLLLITNTSFYFHQPSNNLYISTTVDLNLSRRHPVEVNFNSSHNWEVCGIGCGCLISNGWECSPVLPSFSIMSVTSQHPHRLWSARAGFSSPQARRARFIFLSDPHPLPCWGMFWSCLQLHIPTRLYNTLKVGTVLCLRRLQALWQEQGLGNNGDMKT